MLRVMDGVYTRMLMLMMFVRCLEEKLQLPSFEGATHQISAR